MSDEEGFFAPDSSENQEDFFLHVLRMWRPGLVIGLLSPITGPALLWAGLFFYFKTILSRRVG